MAAASAGTNDVRPESGSPSMARLVYAGYVVTASTSGSPRTASQSNADWFGTTCAVAGSVPATNRSTADDPRRAPATAVNTVPVATATRTATTAKERQRRRSTTPNHTATTFTAPTPRPARTA